MRSENYIEIPCITYNNYEEEMMGKDKLDCEMVEVIKKIDPNRIENYGEAIPLNNFSSDNRIWTTITMYSGDSFIVNLSFKEFEKLLDSWPKKQ